MQTAAPRPYVTYFPQNNDCKKAACPDFSKPHQIAKYKHVCTCIFADVQR